MARNFNNNKNAVNGLIGQLTADKKKLGIAFVLIAVMAVMWIKALGNKGPKTAHAGDIMQTTGQADGQSGSQTKTTFIELPKVDGRHDVLERDFFVMDETALTSSEEVSIVSGDGDSVIRRIAEKLRLEAICLGQRPEAFINDKLVTKGDTLPVTDGDETYQCQIVEIEENSVILKFKQTQIELKFKHENEVAD